MQRILKYALTGATFTLLAGAFNSFATDAEQGNAVGKASATNNAYIVQMADMPVSAYAGGVKGYVATKPR